VTSLLRPILLSLSALAVWAALGTTAYGDEADTPRPRDTLDRVIVTGEREVETPVTERTEQTEKLLKVPGSFGDALQTIYTLPGIVQSEEAGGAPAVRGSGPDDNAFLIDFLPAGYVFHDFGFSIFNENLLRDFGVKTAGFGSRYGKATGAIFDVALREPRQQPWEYTVDASFLRVGALAEGQITDSQSMYISARESMIHLLLKLRADAIEEEEDISFETYPRARDFQAKYSWVINEQNRFSVLAIGAQDETAVRLGGESDIALIDPGVAGEVRLKTGFGSIAANWLYDDGINRLRTAAGYLDESRDLSSGNGAEYSNSDVARTTFKSHFDRVLGRHLLGIGGEYQHSVFDYDLNFRFRSCTNFNPDCRVNRGPLVSAQDSTTIDTIEGFLEDRWQVVDSVAFTAGVHVAHNDYLDETFIEPRAAAEWQINPRWQVNASWGEYHQLPRVGQIIPVFGNPELESLSATHYVLGVKHKLGNDWSWSSDVYYKDLGDVVVDVTTGQQYLNAADGEAYGFELLINKNRDEQVRDTMMDRLYGWLSLSLSKTERRNMLNNTTAVFEYDTPIIANLVMNYRIARAWDVGLRWNFRSGLPYTPIVGNKPNPNFPGFFLPVYGELNSDRAAPYHRLDVRGEYELSMKKFKGSIYVDIINLYNRTNGGAVEYKPVAGTSDYTLEEEESLPLLPSIGVKISF
jgi:hypothetical protein